MNRYKAIVIGASRGGTVAMKSILSKLPDRFPLPIIVALHRSSGSDGTLASMLQSATSIVVGDAESHERVVSGRVYLAPANYHLQLECCVERSVDETASHPFACFTLSTDAPVLFARPSIDILMETAAEVYGPTLAGILLTGSSTDGARGMAAIKRRGGLTIVQDPSTAEFAKSPRAAIKSTSIDRVENLAEIAESICELGAEDE